MGSLHISNGNGIFIKAGGTRFNETPILLRINEFLKIFKIMSKTKVKVPARVKQITDLPSVCDTYEEFTKAIALLLGVQWAEDKAYEEIGRPFDLGISKNFVLQCVRENAKGIVAIERKRTMEYCAMTLEHEVFKRGIADSNVFPFLLVEESGKQHLLMVPSIEETAKGMRGERAMKSLWGKEEKWPTEDIMPF